jgi:fucose permease
LKLQLKVTVAGSMRFNTIRALVSAAAAAAATSPVTAHPIIQSVLPRRYFTISHGTKFMMLPFPSVFAKSAKTAESKCGTAAAAATMASAGSIAIPPLLEYLNRYSSYIR